MSTAITQSFGTELTHLASRLKAAAVWPSPSTGLALQILQGVGGDAPINFDGVGGNFPKGRLDDAPSVAAAAFAMRWSGPNAEETSRWKAGLARLAKKEVFTRDRQTFAYRPAELIGVALGVQQAEDKAAQAADWMRSILKQLPTKNPNGDLWHSLLNAYAASIGGLSWPNPIPSRLDDYELADLGLLVALLRHGTTLLVPGFTDLKADAVEQEFLRRALLAPLDAREVEKLAALYAGLAVSTSSQLGHQLHGGVRGSTSDALLTLELICRRFDKMVQVLNKRHDKRPGFVITDEYDVQDLMHSLLQLHFDVVIPEDTAPARAGNKSRVDFVLKREKVIVETKMTRKSLGQSEVHDELVADRDRYKPHPDSDFLVCFVYDPERRFHNPAAFEHDLNADDERPQMRVFVCPQ